MLISVIVPIFKTEAYLRRCIDSVLSQSYTDFELILVDDGSPDRCGTICEEYRAADPRVKVIHQENQGLSAARNAGIDAAMESCSEWITFIDSDDYVVRNYLEVLLDAAKGYSLSVGTRIMTDGEDIPECTSPVVNYYSPEELSRAIRGNFTISPAKLFRKELLADIRYPVGKIHEDVFFTYKILYRFDMIPFVPQPLYAHFRNQEGIAGSPWYPKRLDLLDGYVEQIAFLTEKGKTDAAEISFREYIKKNIYSQDCIRSYEGLSANEKRMLTYHVRQQLRKILWQYRHYHWCKWWINRRDFRIMVNAYGPEGLRMIWRKTRNVLKG